MSSKAKRFSMTRRFEALDWNRRKSFSGSRSFLSRVSAGSGADPRSEGESGTGALLSFDVTKLDLGFGRERAAAMAARATVSAAAQSRRTVRKESIFRSLGGSRPPTLQNISTLPARSASQTSSWRTEGRTESGENRSGAEIDAGRGVRKNRLIEWNC